MWFWFVAVAAVIVYWLWKQGEKSKKATEQSGRVEGRSGDEITVSFRISSDFDEKRHRGSDADWLRAAQVRAISGREIACGLIYVSDSQSDERSRWRDPSLINTRLRVATVAELPRKGEIGYWPSYAALSPSNRACYLDWLASGRTDESIDTGLLFVFFYGLERRALDELLPVTVWSAELDEIRAETGRLLALHQESGSFQGYAGSFLEFLNCYEASLASGHPELPAGPFFRGRLPLGLQMGLGQFVRAKEPIPVDWAFVWAQCDPSISLRTPARRCKEEFAKVFAAVYHDLFGSGLKIPENKTLLTIKYHPASSARSYMMTDISLDLPDVSVLKKPIDKLRNVVELATDKLDEYSRALGKKSAKDLGDYSLALLPPELLTEGEMPKRVKSLSGFLAQMLRESDRQLIPYGKIIEAYSAPSDGVLSRKHSQCISLLLAKLGFGVEPDIRRDGHAPAMDETVCVYRAVDGDLDPKSTAAPNANEVLLQMGLLLSGADGESPEERALLDRQMKLLPPRNRARMEARLCLLRSEPKSFSSVRRRAKDLDGTQKQAVASFLLLVAAADGKVTKAEIAALSKLYKSLGLDPDSIHAELHSLIASGQQVVAREGDPVRVRNERKTSDEFGIPEDMVDADGTVTLDSELVQKLQADTEAVGVILGEVFADDSPAEATDDDEKADDADDGRPNLNQAHEELLLELLRLEELPRDRWNTMCEARGLLPEAAVEAINEAILETFDDRLILETDPIIIETDVGKLCRRVYE
ncbi:TerB N-terminal domain-containing protein [Candidatus Bipolaricaulota bacterium]